MNPSIKVVFSVLLYAVLTACTPYYLISSSYVASTQSEPQPDVVETPKYRKIIGDINIVGVRAPDTCANESATQRTGQASGESVILKTNCGVEMAEFEKALVRAGFNVISWDRIQSSENELQGTPYEAARALGAQVLFQVNSLERSTFQPGQDARWERRFFSSNSGGNKGNPVEVSTSYAQQFLRLLRPLEASLLPKQRLAATLDATATLVNDGQAIWFYRWTHADPLSKQREKKLLVSCRSNDICNPVNSANPKIETREKSSFGQTEAISVVQNPQNLRNAVHDRLLREVVADLASRFASQRSPSPR